jgi:N-acetylmuramoyl-L-alanine amidase
VKKRYFIAAYILVLSITLCSALIGNRAVAVVSDNVNIERRTCVIVDAGHGGVDGGATSCTGVLESNINLEIAIKLNDLLHLLGIDTKMIRTTDCSVYTKGETIAAKKVSDLKERVRIVNAVPNSLLISIHQNYFPQAQFSGAQVFYNQGKGSEALAGNMQSLFKQTLNHTSRRQPKKATGIYLMDKIEKPGVLIECGFLSNPQEEAALRNNAYQNKLCSVIATTVACHLSGA